MTIYKYKISLLDKQELILPKQAKILSVQVQNGSICIWALVDENLEKEKRQVLIIGTGENIEDDLFVYTYIGTIQQAPYVWHIFIDKYERSV